MSHWWFITDESSILLEKNGIVKGKVENVLSSNNLGYIKVEFSNGESFLYELKQFDPTKNPISSEFNNALLSRSKFVETWKKVAIAGASMKVNTGKILDKTENIIINETSTKDRSSASKQNKELDVKKSHLNESNDGSVPASTESKKLKKEQDLFSSQSFQTAEAIQSKLVGYFDIPVEKLVQPSWNSLTREPEQWHIDQLKEEFTKNPYSYFTLMVINIPGVEKDAFNEDHIDSYVMETIGGNHSRIALQDLIKEQNNQKHLFERRLAAVYCNLTPDESKRKGNEHNAIHKFGLDMNFTSRVISFRCSLYHKAGSTNENDIFSKETPTDKILIQDWKKGLELVTGSENREALNNRFRFEINLAKIDVGTWTELFRFFQNWSQNRISGVPKCSKANQRREISSRNIRCLDGLSPLKLKELLLKVNSGEVTYKQMLELCDQEKKRDKPKKGKRKQGEYDESNTSTNMEILRNQDGDHDSQTISKKKKTEDQELTLQLKETKIRLDATLRKINELTQSETSLKQAQEKYEKELSELQSENKTLLDELKVKDKKLQKIESDLEVEKQSSSKLKDQLKYVIKENSSLKNKENKQKNLLTDQAATLVDRLTPGPLEKLDLQSNNKDEFIEGNLSIGESAIVVIRPVRERDYEPGKPWIGEVTKVTSNFVYIKWLQGTYTSVWTETAEFKDCKPDKVQRNLVAGIVKFDKSLPFSADIVKKIKAIYNDLS